MSCSSSTSSAPLLGIRMSSILQPSQTEGMDQDEILDRLDSLIAQETSYRCEDYLSRQFKAAENQQPQAAAGDEQRDEDPTSTLVDASCREKMCEWSYRVCDHFKVPRNIVATAFSYLDRFVNRCTCDRTAFKLASMTALYMATKLFNGRQLSIATLAELSRGEFDVSHIAEMESIMLKTLDWKLNPPTVHDFCQYFLTFLPSSCPHIGLIEQRALFFAELTTYDYDLILHDRGVVALASILNAIDAVLGAGEPYLANELMHAVLDAIQIRYPSCCSPKSNEPSRLVQSTRRRLWYLHSCSAQASLDTTCPTTSLRQGQRKEKQPRKHADSAPKSPTSVHQVTSINVGRVEY